MTQEVVEEITEVLERLAAMECRNACDDGKLVEAYVGETDTWIGCPVCNGTGARFPWARREAPCVCYCHENIEHGISGHLRHCSDGCPGWLTQGIGDVHLEYVLEAFYWIPASAYTWDILMDKIRPTLYRRESLVEAALRALDSVLEGE